VSDLKQPLHNLRDPRLGRRQQRRELVALARLNQLHLAQHPEDNRLSARIILHLLGLDHERLTYRYAGRDFRLTDVYGEVVQGILA
jgi:hypothetical protein